MDRANRQRGFFDNMQDRPITSGSWQLYEIEGVVAEDAEQIFFGCLLNGKGRLWVDDIELLVSSEDADWVAVEVNNPDFEAAAEGENVPGWMAGSPGYRFELSREGPHSGDLAVLIESAPTLLSAPLFAAHPAVGEVIEGEVGGGLSSRIPLAVYGDDEKTIFLSVFRCRRGRLGHAADALARAGAG